MTHTRDHFKESKVLNVYQVNIWRNLIFMHQVNSNTAPTTFLNKFKKPTHNYLTNFARTNYCIPPFKLNKSKYEIPNFNPRSNVVEKYSNQCRKKATKDQYL